MSIYLALGHVTHGSNVNYIIYVVNQIMNSITIHSVGARVMSMSHIFILVPCHDRVQNMNPIVTGSLGFIV